jgi:hypothetical protein
MRIVNYPEKTNISGKIGQNRKENSFYRSVIGVDSEFNKVVDVRFYGNNKIYCCVWVSHNGKYFSNGGAASGGGYHKESSAFAIALLGMGFQTQNVDAVGDTAIEETIKEIMVWLGIEKFGVINIFG